MGCDGHACVGWTKKIRAPMPHPFHSDGHEKWERSSLPGSKSGSGPRLSLGNGANSVPKVSYFNVYFLAGSHRLRGRASEIRESSIGFANPRAGVADLP